MPYALVANIFWLFLSVSLILMAHLNSPKLTVRFNCLTSDSKKNFLLDFCVKNSIKIEKILEKSFGYIIVCPSIDDADGIFSDGLSDVFAAADIEPVLPNELKAKRSVIINKIDDIVYKLSSDELKHELVSRNLWCVVKDVVKFRHSQGIKITFSVAAMADRASRQGLFVCKLFISSSSILKDSFIPIITCYRCYKFEDHKTHQCPQNDSFRVCSLCASHEHVWKQCQSNVKKCLNCDGAHSALSMMCNVKKQIIKSKRSRPPTTRSFATVIGSAKSPPPRYDFPTDDKMFSKVTSCIILSLFSDYNNPSEFRRVLNKLFLDNDIPNLNLSNFNPPTNGGLYKLLSKYETNDGSYGTPIRGSGGTEDVGDSAGVGGSAPASVVGGPVMAQAGVTPPLTSVVNIASPSASDGAGVMAGASYVSSGPAALAATDGDVDSVWQVSVSGAWNNSSSLDGCRQPAVGGSPRTPHLQEFMKSTPVAKSVRVKSPKNKNRKSTHTGIPQNSYINRNQPHRAAKSTGQLKRT